MSLVADVKNILLSTGKIDKVFIDNLPPQKTIDENITFAILSRAGVSLREFGNDTVNIISHEADVLISAKSEIDFDLEELESELYSKIFDDNYLISSSTGFIVDDETRHYELRLKVTQE